MCQHEDQGGLDIQNLEIQNQCLLNTKKDYGKQFYEISILQDKP
jgi:hypothetical protein